MMSIPGMLGVVLEEIYVAVAIVDQHCVRREALRRGAWWHRKASPGDRRTARKSVWKVPIDSHFVNIVGRAGAATFQKNSRVVADFGLMDRSLTCNPGAIVKSSLTNLLTEVRRLCLNCGLIRVLVPKPFTNLLHIKNKCVIDDRKWSNTTFEWCKCVIPYSTSAGPRSAIEDRTFKHSYISACLDLGAHLWICFTSRVGVRRAPTSPNHTPTTTLKSDRRTTRESENHFR